VISESKGTETHSLIDRSRDAGMLTMHSPCPTSTVEKTPATVNDRRLVLTQFGICKGQNRQQRICYDDGPGDWKQSSTLLRRLARLCSPIMMAILQQSLWAFGADSGRLMPESASSLRCCYGVPMRHEAHSLPSVINPLKAATSPLTQKS